MKKLTIKTGLKHFEDDTMKDIVKMLRKLRKTQEELHNVLKPKEEDEKSN